MDHYIGLDVSMKETSLCIVDEKDIIIYESTEVTDPHAIAKHIHRKDLRVQR